MERWTRWRFVAIVTTLLGVASADQPIPVRAQPVGRYAYRLTDNWTKRPWRLQAGHFGYAADISSSKDGAIYVLDRQHFAVHQLSANHVPLRVWLLPYHMPGAGWTPEKLDVDDDGTLLVLAGETGKRGGRSRVDRLRFDGVVLQTVELDVDYNDIASQPDGGWAMSRSYPLVQATPEPRTTAAPEKGGVDLFSPSGRRLLTLDDRPLFYAVAVDVAPDGTLLTLVRIPNPQTDIAPPFPPTPQPSLALRQDQNGPPLTPLEGVAVYAADHHYVDTWYINNAEDVAVGPAAAPGQNINGLAPKWAAYVSRHLEVFRAGSLEPIYSNTVGQLTSPFLGGAPLHLDVTTDGRLRASIATCYHHGVMDLGRPLGPSVTASLYGELDRPPLGGPVYPLRVDAGLPPVNPPQRQPGAVGAARAGETLVLLQGRYAREDDVLGVTHYFGRPDAEFDQSAERWSADGEPQSEMGVCGGTAASWSPERSDVWWVRDLARDGTDVYTIDANLLRFRPDNGFPGWSFWPGAAAELGEGSRLVAVSADGGRVALLDNGLGKVFVLDRRGRLVGSWLVGGSRNRLPVDLAVRGDRIYVADAGSNTVAVYSPSGGILDEWPLQDGPAAIDVGPNAEVVVLGRSGWLFRYTADGWPEASWLARRGDAKPVDVAVGEGGRVYVPYNHRVWQTVGIRNEMVYEIVEAGIWVFDPFVLPPSPPPAAGGCWAVPEKSASPTQVRLGESVGVELTVQGACPGHGDPLHLVILFDTSRSMNWDAALTRAQDAVLRLLGQLRPEQDQAALITFSDGPQMASGLTNDFASLAARVAGLEAVGDTRISGAMAAARTMLNASPSTPSTRRALVIVSDGDFNDDALGASAPLKADGIELFGVIISTPRFDPSSENRMAAITGSRARVLVNPSLDDLRLALDLARRWTDESRLFRTVTITDVVPTNMKYELGSAVPAATFDGPSTGGGVLTWQLGPVDSASGLALRYRLQPTETGTWPTNVRASAEYVDGVGRPGELAFPVPVVNVWDLAGLRFHVYLPLAQKGQCQLRSKPLDVVLVIDASESMSQVDASGQVKLKAATTAARQFAANLNLARDRVAVVSFNHEAELRSGLVGVWSVIDQALATIQTAPGTQIDLGLAKADQALTQGARAGAKPAVILLTDGLQTGSSATVVDAASILRRHAELFAIGLGTDVDRPLLKEIVSTPSGYRESPDAGQLAEIYAAIAGTLACGD